MKRISVIITMLFVALMTWAQGTTTAKASNSINVGIMLPLHNVDGDGRRMVEYYRGFLLAVNQLKQEGKDINISAWNVPIDADPRTTLLNESASKCNIIFGPLYSKQVKPISDFCKSYNIKMVIPFSISGNDVETNPCIYQVYERKDEIYEATIKHLTTNFKEFHTIFIDCNDTTSKKGAFTFPLRQEMKKAGMDFSITNLNSSNEMFSKAFVSGKPNLVILNTGRSPEMRKAMDKLDILTEGHWENGVQVVKPRKDLVISLFGYTEWLMYTKYNKERFAKYNTYIPTNFFYNAQSPAMQTFIKDFHDAYGQDLMNALPQFAVTGYDHAMYFLGAARSTGSGTAHTWLQTPLKFVKTPLGGYRNKAFMLVHYKNDGGIDALQY